MSESFEEKRSASCCSNDQRGTRRSVVHRQRAALASWLPMALVLANACVARAAQPYLVVKPGATCLSLAALEVDIQQRLVGAQIPAGLSFAVQGSDSDSRSLELQVMRSDRLVSRRRFEPGPASCSALHAVVGLAIALVVKATREEPLEPPAAQTPRAQRWSIAASGVAAYRALHTLTPGLELSAGRLLSEAFEVRVSALGLGAARVALPEDSGAFHAALLALRAELCGRVVLLGPLRGGVCVGVLAGAFYTVGAQVREATRATVPYVALSGDIELIWALSQQWSLVVKALPTYLTHTVSVGLVDEQGTPARSRALARLSIAFGIGPAFFF